MAISLPNPLAEFNTPLVPPPSLAELGGFDVAGFFVTSGEALMKVRLGVRPALVTYRDKFLALTAGRDSSSVPRFGAEIDHALVQLDAYEQELLKMRGDAVWLECSHEPDQEISHRVTCKNPRAKGEPDAK